MRRCRLLLPLLVACAEQGPAEPPASPVAGCEVVETRWAEGQATPWRVDRRAWDDAGNLILDDRALLPDDPRAAHEVRTWRYEGGALVEETERIWQEPRVVPTTVSRHAVDAEGRPRTTEVALRDDDGGETPIGTWAWTWDIAGHLAYKELFTVDGDPVQLLEEVWSKQVDGWVVDRRESWANGDPLTAEHAELDAEERPLRVASDWDGDGTVEELSLWTLDEAGRAVTLDHSGVGVIDSRCTYAWDGADRVEESCWDEFRDATYTTRWTFPTPGRAAVATTTSGGETTEAWSFDWSCP